MGFFNNKTVAIDIDDRSIEIVELKKQTARAKLVNFSRQALPLGVVENGLIKNPEQLNRYLLQAFKQAKPSVIEAKKIAFILPASQCYNLVTSLPTGAESVDDEIIEDLIAKNFPLSAKELIFDYRIIQADPKETLVFISAASRVAVTLWLDFFSSLKLSVELIDSEIFALARDLVYLDQKQPVCLVDVGSVKTNIAIVQAEAVYYENSLSLGGHWFTKKIAQAFNLKLVTAERKKMQLGLNSQIFPVLSKDLKILASEVKAAVAYYQNHYGGAVKEVVLVGGSGRLRGLVDFLQEVVALPVSVGKIKSISEKLPLEYYGALGLAWRVLNKKKFNNEPDFLGLSGVGSQIKFNLTAGKPIKSVSQTLPDKIKKPAKQIMENVDNESTLEPLDGSDDEDLDTGEPDDMQKKLDNQKKVLLLVLLFGLLLLPLAFWYRQQERIKRDERISRYSSQAFNNLQSFNFKIPVIVGGAEVKPGEIKGRIVESTMAKGQTYSQALPDALSRARGKLIKGEVLYEEPLNEIISLDILAEPLVLRWLAYSQPELIKAGLYRVDVLNQEKVDYSFSNLEISAVTKADSIDSLILEVKISITAGKQISNASEDGIVTEKTDSERVGDSPTPTTSPQVSDVLEELPATNTQQVIIKSTETGWLNIREGPGSNFGIVRKIDDGGTYEFLEEKDGWIKIKLSDGLLGWGSARYMQKL